MKKLFTLCLLLLGIATVNAQDIMDGRATVSNLTVQHSGENLLVGMDIDLSRLKVKRGREVLITPIVRGAGEDSLATIRIMGRRRYLYNMRNHLINPSDPYTYRAKKVSSIRYTSSTPYEEWMDNYTLVVGEDECGCCETLLYANNDALLQRHPFVPVLVYVRPEAEVKTRSLEGTAYVDFPVNQTTIYPDYHNNAEELGKIRETINSVNGDEDVTIDNVWLKGYASPESPYAHNRELAIGRVSAIRSYVQSMEHLTDKQLTTAYEPENWEGLRKYVEESFLEHKYEILALIDTDMDPDAKEWKIKSTYPNDYSILLNNCYPYLRRTDYRVNYTIRGYSDVDEIRELLRTNPQKLNLNEIYLLAQTLEPGSEEFNDVFETAVHLYPNDEVANLNAASVEIARGDIVSARKHLEKAGDSGEADYCRGVVAIIDKDYDAALPYLYNAKGKGVAEADACLQYIEDER